MEGVLLEGIYQIKNSVNGKCYIGQSKDIKNRFMRHKANLRHNNHVNKHLQAAWNRYGEKVFEFNIIEECCANELNVRESYWIKFFKSDSSGYNMDSGGDGIRGYKHSEEEIEKMRRIQSPLIVLQFDLEFNFIKRWIGGSSHIRKELNYTKECIDRCCQHRGKLVHYKSCYWVYEDEYNMNNYSWNNYLSQVSSYDYKLAMNKNNALYKSTAICQYDKNRNLIKKWRNLSEIREAGYSSRNITDICRHRKSRRISANCIWCFEGYDFSDGYFDNIKVKSEEEVKTNRKKVNQYDLNGNYIQTFDSLTLAASEVSAPIGNISKVLNGLRNKCKNFRWEYA